MLLSVMLLASCIASALPASAAADIRRHTGSGTVNFHSEENGGLYHLGVLYGVSRNAREIHRVIGIQCVLGIVRDVGYPILNFYQITKNRERVIEFAEGRLVTQRGFEIFALKIPIGHQIRAYSVMEYDVWKYVGVTMKINQTTLTSEMSIAVFDDSDIDSFVSVFEINDKVAEAEMQKYVAALINGEKTVLGKPADYVDLGENFWFDDVRIYNTAMTDGELAVIAKEIDKDYSNIDFDEPEDPTPSESDTTDEQEPPTPSDSDEEETTKQPETSGSDEPQESTGSDEPEQTTAPGGNGSGEGGCSSMLAAPAGIVAVAIVAGCAVRKRRED